jgi:condensin-2 complex subunit H2
MHTMSSQDKNPPFDIGSYGEQILDTFSSSTDNMGIASFSEIVSGRPKYEVARTFSALLQLVTPLPLPVSYNLANPEHF